MFWWERKTSQETLAILSGVAVALVVVMFIALACLFLKRLRRAMKRAFDAESSYPSISGSSQLAKIERLSDLELATGKFNGSNVIGEGAFGKGYEGLLADGNIVAIQRRLHHPIQSLPSVMHSNTELDQSLVNSTARIKHKHLVRLVGFCEENHQQLLVYDYLLNRDVENHLYDKGGIPIGKLDMHQRLLIAIGAAKGFEHLHSLQPPMLHMHFRTRNVLVDEYFTAKASDFGIFRLLVEECYALPSRATDCFLDPQLSSFKDYSEKSDVYSFGVFLPELISGRKAFANDQPNDDLGNLLSQVMKQLLELALLCVDDSIKRPSMKNVVDQLEVFYGTVGGSSRAEETANVTLGSELFNSSPQAVAEPEEFVYWGGNGWGGGR